jgi:FMN phosphatase YigB (HAD superfamily)
MSRSPSSPLPPAFDAVANALTIPPIHVAHVGDAIAAAVEVDRDDIRGVYGVREMRELMGWRSTSPAYAH